MMIAMTEGKWEEFGKYMDTVSDETRRQIAFNIQCYDHFLTFPDDAPEEMRDIVRKAAGVSP